MARFLSTAAFRLSLFYVLVVVISFSISQLLPSLQEVAPRRDGNCYWTNAMLAFVECGSDVFAGSIKSSFYNFWLGFLYLPLFHSWKTLLIYAPIIVILYRMACVFRNRSAQDR